MGSIVEDRATASADTTHFANLCFEVLWGPPGFSDGDWADITRFVVAGSCSRGRTYETDQFETGACTLTLHAMKTEGRLFDPENVDGPYYGLLHPMVQVRISASSPAGTLYPVWRGYITSWGQTTPHDKLYETTIRASDGFFRLNQFQLPSSAWALEVQQDDPSLWFRLGETNTARVTDSSPGGNYGIYDNVTQGAQGLVPNDDDGAVDVGTDYDPADSRVTIQNPSLISGYPFTVSAMFKLAANPSYSRVLFAGAVDITDGIPGIIIDVESSAFGLADQLRASVYQSAATRRTIVSSSPVADNLPHHALIAFASASSFTMYIDGVDVTTVFTSGSPTWPGDSPNGYTIGNYTDVLFGAYGFRGIIDEVCVWNGTALAADRAAAHSLAAKTGWDDEDTGTRVDRFLTAIEWPTALRDIETGISTLGPASWSIGTTALSVIQGWSATESGQCFIDPNGKLVWQSRHHRYLDTRSKNVQATFGDKASGATFLVDDVELKLDETLIRNPVIASRAGGVSVTKKDQTLIDNKYGPRSWASPTTEDRLDSAVHDRATWLLAKYKDQTTRLASLQLSPDLIPTMWDTVLSLEISDRIQIKRTPLGIGTQIVVDQWVERIEHQFTAKTWTTTLVGSPVEDQSYLVLDDATLGLLDTGVLAY